MRGKEASEQINILGDDGVPIEYHDANIDLDKFKNMTIKLSPKATMADKIIVEALMKEYNPEATIEESHIKIR